MHTVLENQVWEQSFLITKIDELELLLRNLKRWGFSFAKASEFRENNKAVAYLTFDDGYLDNWTILFPYLNEHRIPFTIFVNKDFVEDSERVRDFGDRTPGYLSVGEIRRMHESGLVDIQSHTVSHTSVPISCRVENIFKKELKRDYPFIMWNRELACKPYWLHNSYVKYFGLPLFQSDRALRAIQYVFDNDALAHFEQSVKEKRLNTSAANKLLEQYSNIGRYETYEERDRRYRDEISQNAHFIKAITGTYPNVLCWPGGAFNEHSESIAYQYHNITTIKRGYGNDKRYLHRISPINPYKRDTIPWCFQTLTLLFYTLRHATRGLLWTLRNKI